MLETAQTVYKNAKYSGNLFVAKCWFLFFIAKIITRNLQFFTKIWCKFGFRVFTVYMLKFRQGSLF